MPQSKHRPPRSDVGPGGEGGDEYIIAYKNIDFREHPELYRVGVGEQGVLAAEPFKSEICAIWRFRTPELAKHSATQILYMFFSYQFRYTYCQERKKDPNHACEHFVGMDMCRKYLMMGWTRSRRYANHRGGRKWVDGKELPRVLPGEDARCDEFAESAAIFKERYDLAKNSKEYVEAVKEWNERFGSSPLKLAREIKALD